MTPSYWLMKGDCRQLLGLGEPDTIDVIVTDPPYGLSREPDITEVMTHWLRGDDYAHRGSGFMGKTWDSFVPGPSYWRAAYRVLKPGAYLVAFGGTRTVDLLTIAIRLAGFEIRDTLVWLYGSGFPKSLDAERGIAVATCRLDGRHFLRQLPEKARPGDHICPATPESAPYDGYGTALKPGHEPIILARKPIAGTVAANVAAHGTGAINVDACRIGTGGQLKWAEPRDMRYHGGTDSVAEATASDLGRWPVNVLLSHTDECREIGTRRVKAITNGPTSQTSIGGSGVYRGGTTRQTHNYADSEGYETVEAWECSDDCPVRMLDEQSGERKAGGVVRGTEPSRTGQNGIYGTFGRVANQPHGDTGGASRFFYCAKASRSERNAGLDGMPERPKHTLTGDTRPSRIDGKRRNDHTPAKPSANTHPTVKPIALMRYLVRLVTPPNGIVVDPFVGSGTTGIAATLEGFNFVGMDLDEEDEYLPIAERRIAHWLREESSE